MAVLAAASAAAFTSMMSAVRASSVAQDVSTNYTTYGNFNTQNMGSGFGAFNVVQSGTTGGDYVDSAANGGFDIYDNGTQVTGGALTDQVTAIRPFTGALTTGQDFSFTQQLHYASNPSNGGPSNLGFSLDDSSGNALFDFHIQGGGSGYILSDATQSLFQTTTPYNYNSPDTFSFTLNSAATGAYTFTVSGASISGGPQTYTGTISEATGGVSEAAIYNNNGGGGSDMHFDNLSITNGGSVWSQNASGDWNNASNWTNAIVPNAPGAVADFFGIITTAQTVYSNTPVTAGTVSFNNSNAYVIAGAGSLTLQASTGSAQISVLKGSHTIQLPVTFASNTTLSVAPGSTLNLTNAVTVDASAAITQTGGGAVNYSNVVTLLSGASLAFGGTTTANTLDVANTAVASVGGTGSVLTLNNLGITPGGTLNIGSNELLVKYGSGADPISSISALLKSGFNNGAWTGTGITSSTAQTTSGSYGLGYADAADPGNPAGLAAGTIEVVYTLLGDANLDGSVNGVDFAIMAANFNKADQVGHSGWAEGDFNYDGSVNGADFAPLAANFNKGTSLPGDAAALDSFAAANGLLADVPEPSCGALTALAAVGILRRRRAKPRNSASI